MEQDSPAKQFLAAVSKASQELETAIAQTYEEALKLNVQLTESARVQMEQTDAALERELRHSTNLVLEERQKILVELADLRQQEMRILTDTGKMVREHLTDKLEELITAFDSKIKTSTESFQEKLSQVEDSLAQKINAQTLQLSETITAFSKVIRAEIQEKNNRLQDFANRQQNVIDQLTTDAATNIRALRERLEAMLRSDAQTLLSHMEDAVLKQEPNHSTADRISRLKEIAITEEAMLSHIAPDLEQMRQLPQRFQETCQELAAVHNDVHEAAIRNTTVRYKTELLAAAQHSEDQLKLIKSEVQLTLKQFEKVYADRFEQRLADFEKDSAQEVQDALSDQERAGIRMSATKDKELKDLYIQLRRGASESLRATVVQTERTLESLFDDYKIRLENQRIQKSSELEQECRRATEELNHIFKNFDSFSNDMEKQLSDMEVATAELDEFVSALSHADLDF